MTLARAVVFVHARASALLTGTHTMRHRLGRAADCRTGAAFIVVVARADASVCRESVAVCWRVCVDPMTISLRMGVLWVEETDIDSVAGF